MKANVHKLSEAPSDNPIPKLTRTMVEGERMLLAYVQLAKGCHVEVHRHENEQIAFIQSGRVRFRLGEPGTSDYREEVVEGGTVVHMPSNCPHGVEAMEDTVIVDVLSPPGKMGVDSQGG